MNGGKAVDESRPDRPGGSPDRLNRRFSWAALGSLVLHLGAIGALCWLSLSPPPPSVAELVVDLVALTPAPPAAPASPAPPQEEPPPPAAAPVAVAKPVPPPKAEPKPRPKAAPAAPSSSAASVQPPAAAPAAGDTRPATPAASPPAAAIEPPPPAAVGTDFANLVFDRINRIARRNYPEAAILRHQQGKVVYHLLIGPAGELLEHGIEPSGIETLDRAAEQAITAAAPFPKPPDLGAKAYRLGGAIVYRLEN